MMPKRNKQTKPSEIRVKQVHRKCLWNTDLEYSVNINYFCLTQPHKLASTYLSKVDRKIYYFWGGKVKSQGLFLICCFHFLLSAVKKKYW